MRKFKVLILYPNGTLMNPPPISVGIFTALLRDHGFDVELFDSTLYPESASQTSDDAKKENLQVRPFDYGSKGIKIKESRLEDDLEKKIQQCEPDLIMISILECTYARALTMLNVLEDFDIPVIAGGVFPTSAPDKVLANKNVKMVCIGEGEETIVELCERMLDGKDYLDIRNICFKENGKIRFNPLRRPLDINALPIPDYSLFEWERFCRPMAGKIYKTIPIETNRGCPYNCSFCNSPSIAKYYKDNNFRFFRSKRMDVIKEEIKTLWKQWGAEYVYFTSDNFLVGPDKMFDEFIEIYRDVKLPFWMQVRPEMVTEYRMKKLKSVGCHRMSIGVEHGNAEFRKNVLNKCFDNETVINASKIIADVEIPLTINNMIGFPDETRELIFDTIELNRKLTSDSTNCAVFAPFHGTSLQKMCVEKGYVSDDFIFGSLNVDAPLDMSQLSREEIKGLRRVFALYVGLEKEHWPMIEKAEKFTDEGNTAFVEVSKIYKEKYFS